LIRKTIEATIIQSIVEFVEQMKRGGDILLQIHDLTSQQWTLLLHIAGDPNVPFYKNRSTDLPLTASELAGFFHVSRANMTNLVNTLVDKQLVVHEEDSIDKRRKTLKLTPKGLQLVQGIEILRQDANNRLFASFSQFEKSLFLDFVDRCLNYMEEENKKLKENH
jgi:DNA-binding MarR family transcriptional regulator